MTFFFVLSFEFHQHQIIWTVIEPTLLWIILKILPRTKTRFFSHFSSFFLSFRIRGSLLIHEYTPSNLKTTRGSIDITIIVLLYTHFLFFFILFFLPVFPLLFRIFFLLLLSFFDIFIFLISLLAASAQKKTSLNFVSRLSSKRKTSTRSWRDSKTRRTSSECPPRKPRLWRLTSRIRSYWWTKNNIYVYILCILTVYNNNMWFLFCTYCSHFLCSFYWSSFFFKVYIWLDLIKLCFRLNEQAFILNCNWFGMYWIKLNWIGMEWNDFVLCNENELIWNWLNWFDLKWSGRID